ncbi:MAG: hypothetical protein HYX60_01530, partial [Legionella longbeachae]|nr:hypothetical protein [Legionella longbeachae]
MNWLNVWQWMLDFGWLLILLIIFKHFLQNRQTLKQAQSWLKAKGHITECEWIEIGHNVWPKIEYTYQVYDKEMTGEYLFL